MLYSCLVDADYLDTEQFMQGDMPRGAGDSLETLLTRLQARLNEWDSTPTSEVNKRCQQLLPGVRFRRSQSQGHLHALRFRPAAANDQFSRICAASCR